MTTQETTAEATGLSRYIQRLLARARAFDARRPAVWDAAVTLFWTGAALVDASGGWRNTAPDPSVPVWLVFATSLALTLPLYWRRRMAHGRPRRDGLRGARQRQHGSLPPGRPTSR